MRLWLAGALVLSAIALLGHHLLTLARWGYWHSWSTITVVSWLGGGEWVIHPKDWLGVHAALLWLPLWGACFIAALLLAIWKEGAPDL